MVMPKYHELFNQVMETLGDGQAWRSRDLRDEVVSKLDLTDAERSETMGGGGNRAASRVHWATESLFQSGAISRPRRGYLQLTEFGRELMRENPSGIDVGVLEQTEGLKEWYRRSKESSQLRRSRSVDENSEVVSDPDITPDEQIEEGVARLRAAIAEELLDRLRTEPPAFLENVVLKLLHAMGYGEGDEDALHLGGSGDGGVDGVINQDKLGLDQIYIQAKRYGRDSTVGPGAIRDFNTAVQTKKASRGVFITTSRFTSDAVEVLRDLPYTRIVLIDGDQLTDLMLEHGVGVTVDKEYTVFKIDENFFED